MIQFLQYYGKFQSFRGNMTGLPGWGRALIFVAALPGILLLSLSILAFVVSLFALLVLTVPVYRLLRALTTPPSEQRGNVEVTVLSPESLDPQAYQSPSGRRQIDVKIVE